MTTPPTVPLDWNGYVAQIATLAVVGTTSVGGVTTPVDAAVVTALPQACNYAELRIQRDLAFLQAQETRTYTLQAGVPSLSIPVEDFVITRTVGIINGSKTDPCLSASVEWLQTVYNDTGFQAQPEYFAVQGGDLASFGATSTLINFGPCPDQSYSVSVLGTVRLPSLYNFANPTDASGKYTFISQWLPDLMIQASMIYISQYQRNFGAASNDPEMPGSYENQYQTLLRGATVENARNQFAASAWSSQAPAVAATPDR